MIGVAILGCTFVLSTSCIVYFLSTKHLQKTHSYIFLFVMIDVAVSAGSDVISNFIEETTVATGGLFALQYVTQIIFFLTHTALSPLYALYVMMVNGSGLNRRSRFFYLVFTPMILIELLFLTNPITKWMFYYDENADFVRGPIEYSAYVVAGIYLIFSIYYMVRYRNAITRSMNIALWYFFSFTFIGILIQMLFAELKVELFAETVSMLGVMLTIENEDALIDSSTRVYNRQAFINDNISLLHTGHHYVIISLNITNLRYYFRIWDYSTVSTLLRMIAGWIRTINKKVRVYRVTVSNITLTYLYRDPDEISWLIAQIVDRFKEPWNFGGTKIDLNMQIYVAYVPEEFDDVNMMVELADAEQAAEKPGVHVVYGKKIEQIKRRSRVERAIKTGLSEGNFEVYYQPIWNAETQKIESAEALLRLKDPTYGSISPDEFIPIAEQNGMIIDIGKFVFEQVCIFLTDERSKGLGLHYIEVNLSTFQLLVNNTLEDFLEIMKKYGVTASQINLEITESGDMTSSAMMLRSINEMQKQGFTFSLDDYGTGYSNLASIMSMDFLNIKSDKGLLWDADANGNSGIMLKDTIQTMRRLGMNVMQEGVETKEQLDMVVAAGANLIQGYYFSKPLPAEKFCEYLEQYPA